VVGEDLRVLTAAHPGVVYAGAKPGEEPARHDTAADVSIVPSSTGTFGLVMLEALAAGVPVAAYPVPGPLDVVDGSGVGVLDDDLARAAGRALLIPRDNCRDYALKFSWQHCAVQFLGNLAPFR